VTAITKTLATPDLHPEGGPRQERIPAAFGGMRCAARVEGAAVCRRQMDASDKKQILRLRARPTRKSGGSEKQGGRSAQDDK